MFQVTQPPVTKLRFQGAQAISPQSLGTQPLNLTIFCTARPLIIAAVHLSDFLNSLLLPFDLGIGRNWKILKREREITGYPFNGMLNSWGLFDFEDRCTFASLDWAVSQVCRGGS